MSNVITVYGTPKKWEGEGKFHPRMLDFSNFDRWFNLATVEFRNVIDRFDASLADDGKIDIMERKEIVREIDEYLNCLLALRFHLYQDLDSFSVDKPESGYTFTFNREGQGWTGEGVFHKTYKLNMEKFRTWYETIMMKNFNVFSEQYKKIVQDGVIDDDEKLTLHPIIDQFIFEVMYIRHYIDKYIWKEKD